MFMGATDSWFYSYFALKKISERRNMASWWPVVIIHAKLEVVGSNADTGKYLYYEYEYLYSS